VILMGINEYIKIGKKIKKLRKEKGYSQKQMAKLCGIAYSTYSNYENDNREPSMKQIEKIASVLEISTAELLDFQQNLDISCIDNYNYHLFRLLETKDKLSTEQILLDASADLSSEEGRIRYASECEYIQFNLRKVLSELDDFKKALSHAYNTSDLTTPYKILFELQKLNPAGEKKVLEELENLSFNPKYQVPLLPQDFDPYENID